MTSKTRFVAGLLNQTAVWWQATDNDGDGGRVFADGVEINVRWEHEHERFVDDQEREIVSRAVVFVDRDIDAEDYLYLGTLDVLTSGATNNPYAMGGAYEVRSFEKTPSIDGQRFVRRALL